MGEAGDDHVSRAVAELGEPDARFEISRARYHAKLWTGIGLIGSTVVAILIGRLLGLGFAALGIAGKFLLTPPVIGGIILFLMYRNRGLVVLVYPTGLLRLQRGEVESYPWDDIVEVRLKLQRIESPELRYDSDDNVTSCWLPTDAPTFQIWKTWIVVERSDGTVASFGPALAEYERLAELVQRRTFPRIWGETRDRLLDGQTVAFGDLETTPAGLRFAGKFLPWRQMKDLVVAQGRLTIKKTGGWLPWAIIDVSKVPNPHVLFALVSEARKVFASAAPTGQPQPAEADHDADV